MCTVKPNNDIRELMQMSGIKQWQVAREVGLSASYFCVLMRKPLPEKYRKLSIQAIKKLYYSTEKDDSSRENLSV